jgi:hypothetical protein
MDAFSDDAYAKVPDAGPISLSTKRIASRAKAIVVDRIEVVLLILAQ